MNCMKDSRIRLQWILPCILVQTVGVAQPDSQNTELAAKGRYLATIGVCSACHTPSKTGSPDPQLLRTIKSDPDWFNHLDWSKDLAGGVPFIIRVTNSSNGVVVTPNITPDQSTGIGRWTKAQIVEVLRSGKRPDGSSLFRFPPHTFYENLAQDDLEAIASYLKSVPPVANDVPPRQLPFPTIPGTPPEAPTTAPVGRTTARAEYLMRSLVGCAECHSHREGNKQVRFAGGQPGESILGIFRLGPDLPVTSTDKGLAAFPYPGYAVLYGGNLTRFGNGGDLSHVTVAQIVRSMRDGVSTVEDRHGRQNPLAYVMMWQFYASMVDDDAYAIAEYIKSLRYVPNPLDGKSRLLYFGSDTTAAFEQAFGEHPSQSDKAAFGIK
jgi:mono/diheme cytochrome c family protein